MLFECGEGLWLLGVWCMLVDVYFIGIVCWVDYYVVFEFDVFLCVVVLCVWFVDDVGV